MRLGALGEFGLYAIAIVLFVFSASGRTAPNGSAVSVPLATSAIRVVTWNVGGAEGGSGRRMNDANLPQIAATLRELDPDLCFLQEVGRRDRLERLGEALGDGWTWQMRGDVGRRVAVLYRSSVTMPVWLNEPEPGVTSVIVQSESGARIGAVGVHADAWSSATRNRTIGVAANLVATMLDAGAADLGVLAGDLNLDLDLGKRHDLFSDDEYRDVETYNYVASRMYDTALGAGSTAEPDRRLDYVFVTPGTEVRHAAPWKGRRAEGMDHDPLVVDLIPPN